MDFNQTTLVILYILAHDRHELYISCSLRPFHGLIEVTQQSDSAIASSHLRRHLIDFMEHFQICRPKVVKATMETDCLLFQPDSNMPTLPWFELHVNVTTKHVVIKVTVLYTETTFINR